MAIVLQEGKKYRLTVESESLEFYVSTVNRDADETLIKFIAPNSPEERFVLSDLEDCPFLTEVKS